jgi:MFS family permease
MRLIRLPDSSYDFYSVSDIVSLKDRGKYQGINEAIIAISNGIGPILGGVFSEDTTWRWAFWINLPLGGAAIAVSLWLLPVKKVHGDMKSKLLKIDYAGSFLTIVSSVLLLARRAFLYVSRNTY